MALAIKTLLSCAGLTGGVCAVSIPVTLSKTKSSEAKEQVILSQCDVPKGEQGESVSFGDNEISNLCWQLEGEDNKLLKNSTDSYTNLFKAKWIENNEDYQELKTNLASEWTDQCIDSNISSPWVLFSEEEGVKYEGLCGSYKVEETKFIKRKKQKEGENGNSPIFWICEENCFKDAEQSDNKTILKKENDNNWKKVSFYKK